ncbi:MAG TPA: peptide-methionine (S)-S-oxide reductase MsrA [Longimicrobium sp.]|jgi:peptide-methionine (S)-S-oxide reductase
MRPGRGWLRRAVPALLGGALAAASVRGAPAEAQLAVATFAAGCFWCSESDFEHVPGVVDAVSGFTGGRVANPTYEQVSGGRTGHREAVQVRYDPKRVSYAQLLNVYWRNVDPVDSGGQFCDRGPQYTSAIFVANEEERRLAEASLRAVERSGRLRRRIATVIVPAAAFYRAEEYHQAYYKKNPVRYRFYRTTCGRDRRLRQLRARASATRAAGGVKRPPGSGGR